METDGLGRSANVVSAAVSHRTRCPLDLCGASRLRPISIALLFVLLNTRRSGSPSRSVTHCRAMICEVMRFQSTRPHGARPPLARVPSCHPAFQSTRPHGARQTGGENFVTLDMFQSTRPHGARLRSRPCFYSSLTVSIHAPARGATSRRHRGRSDPRVSIHAPARGATKQAHP